MAEITNKELIEKAASLIKPRKIANEREVGRVGAALVSDKGNVFFGVSVDTCCGMGLCAEHVAVAAMITSGEYRVKKIVAVGENGAIFPPCGRCREFIHQIDGDNLDADVIVDKDKTVKLRDLLPIPWDEKRRC